MPVPRSNNDKAAASCAASQQRRSFEIPRTSCLLAPSRHFLSNPIIVWRNVGGVPLRLRTGTTLNHREFWLPSRSHGRSSGPKPQFQLRSPPPEHLPVCKLNKANTQEIAELLESKRESTAAGNTNTALFGTRKDRDGSVSFPHCPVQDILDLLGCCELPSTFDPLAPHPPTHSTWVVPISVKQPLSARLPDIDESIMKFPSADG